MTRELFGLKGSRGALALLGLMLLWATSALATDISGTITNNTAATGRVYLRVVTATGETTSLGTSIDLATTNQYTIRGNSNFNGDYKVQAGLDTAGYGVCYENAPRGQSATPITFTNGEPSGPANVTISTPTQNPPTLTGLDVMAGNGGLLLFVKPALTGRGYAKADHFSVCYDDNADFTSPTCPTEFTNVPVTNAEENMLAMHDLPNGEIIYFRATPYFGATAGAAVTNSATPTAPTGGHTVSGTVNLNFAGTPPPAGASVYVLLFNDRIPGVQQPTVLGQHFTLAQGATTVPFSIVGVPDGYFFVYTLVDLNANGVMDIGDPMATGEQLANLVDVAGQNLTDVAIEVTDAPLISVLKSRHNLSPQTDFNQVATETYGLNFELRGNGKRPAAVALVNAPQGAIGGPFDLMKTPYGEFSFGLNDLGFRPQASDIFNFEVTYTDGSTESLELSTDTVLDSFPAPPITPTGYILDNRPDFTWSAPASPPQPLYSYYLDLWGKQNGTPTQLYPAGTNQKDYLISSSTTSLAYPLVGNLAYNEKYLFQLSIVDLFGNQTTVATEFMPVQDGISGTVTNQTGHNGRVYLKVFWPTGQETPYGTSIDLNTTNTFNIRGISMQGDFVVGAFLDETNPPVGMPYSNSAQGASQAINVSNGVATGSADLTLAYPQSTPPAALQGIDVMTGDGALFVFVKPERNQLGFANADHFTVCYDSDQNFANPVCPPEWDNLPITGQEVDLGLNGLENDAPLYFRATPSLGGTPGTAATSSGTPSAPTGGNTVSGQVNFNFTFPNTPPVGTGVYVALINDRMPGVTQPTALLKHYSLAEGTFVINYTIEGVPDGLFNVYALADLNNNGVMDISEPKNTDNNTVPLVEVAGQPVTNANIFLNDDPLTSRVTTQHQSRKDVETYSLNTSIADGSKRPAAVALTGGPGVTGPVDLGLSQWRDFQTHLDNLGFRPQGSDIFNYEVTYTDGTTGTIGTHADIVLDAFATAPITPVGYLLNNPRPDFSWGAPANPPQPFYNSYFQLERVDFGGSTLLYPSSYDTEGNLLPFGATSKAYPLVADLNYDQLYQWTVSIIDRFGNQADVTNEFIPVTQLPATPVGIGVYHQGNWYLDKNGNGDWEWGTDFYGSFGDAAMTPVAGDWTGNGQTTAGVYVGGTWYFDLNGNGQWDGVVTDRMVTSFGGAADDVPVVGDWNGDGVTEIGVYRQGVNTWYLDYNGNFGYDWGVDIAGAFGFAGCLPVVGDWNGNGHDKVGVYSGGQWYLDLNGNYAWDGTPTDTFVPDFGFAGALPVVGDWNGSGNDRLGVYYNGQWFLDGNGNSAWDGTPTDAYIPNFGFAGAIPVVGNW